MARGGGGPLGHLAGPGTFSHPTSLTRRWQQGGTGAAPTLGTGSLPGDRDRTRPRLCWDVGRGWAWLGRVELQGAGALLQPLWNRGQWPWWLKWGPGPSAGWGSPGREAGTARVRGSPGALTVLHLPIQDSFFFFFFEKPITDKSITLLHKDVFVKYAFGGPLVFLLLCFLAYFTRSRLYSLPL